MICFMYPGQPLAFESGLSADQDFLEIAALTQKHCGLDLSTLAWRGSRHTDQVKLQVYGVALSLYRARRLGWEGISPAIAAEHSMGIYPAMASCDALPPGEALELTLRIGDCLATMGERQEYAIGCITGLPAAPLMGIAENNGIHLANYNTSRHFLVSGRRQGVEDAVAEAVNGGAFTGRTFPCDAPLHTPLIEEIAGELRNVVSDYRFSEPRVPLMNHIDQDCLTAGDLPGFLVRELSQPVYWERTFKALCSAGATRFVEVGAGESLKKYNRWITTEAAR